jgi:hypothetical protein
VHQDEGIAFTAHFVVSFDTVSGTIGHDALLRWDGAILNVTDVMKQDDEVDKD